MVDLPAGRQARGSQNKMYYVYILQSMSKGVFYKGLTNNLERRLQEHLQGKSPSTKHLLPVKLIHVEICRDRNRARELEIFFKSGFGREIVQELAEVVEW